MEAGVDSMSAKAAEDMYLSDEGVVEVPNPPAHGCVGVLVGLALSFHPVVHLFGRSPQHLMCLRIFKAETAELLPGENTPELLKRVMEDMGEREVRLPVDDV